MRDIADLTKNKPAVDAQKTLTEKMNALLIETDRRLINEWHPRRPKHAWPKGISK